MNRFAGRSFPYKILVFGLLFGTLTMGQRPNKLQHMNIDDRSITLSGFSSGGTFAQQLQFSYAKLFKGIAVFSHTYYRCGPTNGNVTEYDNECTLLGNVPQDKLYDVNKAVRDIRKYYEEGLIENPDVLRNKRLYVYTGLENFLFTPTMSLRILKLYEPYIKNQLSIRTEVQNAGLVLPSNTYGGNCSGTPEQHFLIGNCNYSGPTEALKFLLAPCHIKYPDEGIQIQPLLTFDQTEFFINERHDMDTLGYLYIPWNCDRRRRNKCLLHFYFHGCSTGRVAVDRNHVEKSGYLELAEANNIITVFPQAINSTENDIGCWDTYGFTSPFHATRRGAQVRVVKRMLDRILGKSH